MPTKNGLRVYNPNGRSRTVAPPEHLPVTLDEHHLAQQQPDFPDDWPCFDAPPVQHPVTDE